MPKDLTALATLVLQAGFQLDDHQPHILGERFLMQAVTAVAGQKYILLAHNEANERFVLKVTNDPAGKQEIEHERLCRSMINSLAFAYDTFAVPKEVFHKTLDGYLVNAQQFIPQTCAFLERPLREQFDLALKAFVAQEQSRATTDGHLAIVKKTFGLMETADYLRLMHSFCSHSAHKPAIAATLATAQATIIAAQNIVTQYGGFLTHSDFVPHNFRIADNKMYLLDFSAIRFGNKHESWARFLNFMTLYHPALEAAFLKYFSDNRAPEEYQSLHLMRLYRLGEIITYYQKTLDRSADKLRELNLARIDFWHDVLRAEIAHERITEDRRLAYTALRDSLRSDEEKMRQIGLH